MYTSLLRRDFSLTRDLKVSSSPPLNSRQVFDVPPALGGPKLDAASKRGLRVTEQGRTIPALDLRPRSCRYSPGWGGIPCCQACCWLLPCSLPTASPGPFRRAAPHQPVPLQGFAAIPAELHHFPAIPLLQPLQVPLDGSPALVVPTDAPQSGVICKLEERVLHHLLQEGPVCHLPPASRQSTAHQPLPSHPTSYWSIWLPIHPDCNNVIRQQTSCMRLSKPVSKLAIR